MFGKDDEVARRMQVSIRQSLQLPILKLGRNQIVPKCQPLAIDYGLDPAVRVRDGQRRVNWLVSQSGDFVPGTPPRVGIAMRRSF